MGLASTISHVLNEGLRYFTTLQGRQILLICGNFLVICREAMAKKVNRRLAEQTLGFLLFSEEQLIKGCRDQFGSCQTLLCHQICFWCLQFLVVLLLWISETFQLLSWRQNWATYSETCVPKVVMLRQSFSVAQVGDILGSSLSC